MPSSKARQSESKLVTSTPSSDRNRNVLNSHNSKKLYVFTAMDFFTKNCHFDKPH